MTLEHISYSQYRAYTDCPRSWYLGKLKQAEERQTWFLPVGTAVHQMIEDLLQSPDAEHLPSAQDYFYPLIEKQLRVEPDISKWLAGGPKDAPIVAELALKQVEECFERALTYLEDIDVWHIEYDVSGRLPNLEVSVKGFADIIGEHKRHGPIVWDWKTGRSKPKDNFQLQTYGALLRTGPHKGDLSQISKAAYVMLNPLSSVARPVDLSEVDPGEIGLKYQEVYTRMKARLYETRAGYRCRNCFQQDNCILNSGTTERAVYYDRAEEEGFPF